MYLEFQNGTCFDSYTLWFQTHDNSSHWNKSLLRCCVRHVPFNTFNDLGNLRHYVIQLTASCAVPLSDTTWCMRTGTTCMRTGTMCMVNYFGQTGIHQNCTGIVSKLNSCINRISVECYFLLIYKLTMFWGS